nr:metallophosphoesterase [Aurantiacibacter sp. 219JJ12-13]MDP5262698.1 metallophosphoesterase [Aurantiacibacter sp. 219JJ12-13]
MARLLPVIRRRWKLVLGAMVLGTMLLGAKVWHDTMADPVVRTVRVQMPGLDTEASGLTLALISDIHVAGPDMPPERLSRIVEQINALDPDLVLVAGDFVSEKPFATHIYSPEEIIAPLADLRAPLGTVVVPGNHDHWFDWPALEGELEEAGVTILENEAIQVGPLALGGVDDAYTRREDLSLVLDAMDDLDGARLILSHSPDIFPQAPADVPLVLAGHTHCGQIRYPWGGAPATMSRYGDRFACGVTVEGGKTVIVGAGLGTSLMPVRFNTQPEIWLVELVAK